VPPAPFAAPLSRRLLILLAVAILLVAAEAAGLFDQPATVTGQGEVGLRITGGETYTWDPAAAGDASSAAVLAQVFEGLTTFDVNNEVRPALADRWQISDDGRQITFHLRPGIVFSDGTPITTRDVVDSWLRLIDPQRPSPLSSLLADIEGVAAYLGGQVGSEAVGLRADGDNVVVTMRRPASYFVAVTGSPSLAVVPPSMRGALDSASPPTVISGAYVPTVSDPGVIRFEANPRYWAGEPPIAVIEQVTDLGGNSPVTAFESGDVDYTPIASFDAAWIRYDTTLGPQLRQEADFTLTYYGFDTTSPPFDDQRVRLAFVKAVNWDRIVPLASGRAAATSMLPPGIPGRDDIDYRPAYDPDAARELLAQAGYPDGGGFPAISLVTYGVGYELTAAAEIESVLGIHVEVEVRDFQDYFALLAGPDRPAFWTLSWIADYPQAHDFLGLLLESGSSSNPGGFSNADYDRALESAAAAADPAEQAGFYAAAQSLLRDQAPVIPVDYSEGWALSRDGLLGAQPSGLGLLRFAGLAWAPGSGR